MVKHTATELYSPDYLTTFVVGVRYDMAC